MPMNSERLIAPTHVFKDMTADIKKIRLDKNNVYVLTKCNKKFDLKSFKMLSEDGLKQSGEVSSLQDGYQEFIDAFLSKSHLNFDVLLTKDLKLMKIYDDKDGGKVDGHIQSYNNFLPKLEPGKEDRLVSVANMKNCKKQRKLLMESSYPKSFQQKEITICPYVCDNSIETSKEAEKGTISWMADIESEQAATMFRTSSSNVETSKESTETFVFQYNVNTHVMQ